MASGSRLELPPKRLRRIRESKSDRLLDHQLVWVFETEKALNDFVNSGWEFGGQATAAAKAGDKGTAYQGAVAVGPGVWLYGSRTKAWRWRGPSITRTVI